MATKKPKTFWNHRIMAHEYKGDIYFQVHEVHYKNEIPDSYTKDAIKIGGESIADLKWSIQKIYDAILLIGSNQDKHKIIWAGDKFPQYYKPK